MKSFNLQQFGKRNTCTPTDASQVRCSVAVSSNREETLGEHSLKTFPNNLDVNQRQHTVAQKLSGVVYVLSVDGKPLMPTTSPKARRLLRENKAKVVSRNPYAIRLLVPCRNETQQVILKIDSGYKDVGFSAGTEKSELICGEVKLRTDVVSKLNERRMYRRQKRNKLWYRKARFDNRVASKKKGWFAPSIEQKLGTHVNLVSKIKRLLPISKVIVEVASFDTQKMVNPEISGVEYQQGTLQGYEVREYLLEKYQHTCQYCKKSGVPLEIEHIIPKCKGGSDRVSNLTIACHSCNNQKKGNLTAEEFGYPEIQKQALMPLKSCAFMNIVKKKLVEVLNADSSFGYVTKYNRIKLGLEKTHYNDAFCIGEVSNAKRCKPLFFKKVRRNNRCLQLNRNGFAPSIRRKRYDIQPHDLV